MTRDLLGALADSIVKAKADRLASQADSFRGRVPVGGAMTTSIVVEPGSVGGRPGHPGPTGSAGGRPGGSGTNGSVGGRPGSSQKRAKRVKSRPVDTPVSTMDPVSLVEIADRCGVSREKVGYWRTAGLLPDPDWTLSGVPVWAWERLRDEKVVAVQLGTWTWDDLQVPTSPTLRSLGVVETKGWVTTARRIDRHGYGWLTVPVSTTHRLLITDDPGEAGVEVTWAEADGLVRDALAGYTVLRRTAPQRVGEPMVSERWLTMRR